MNEISTILDLISYKKKGITQFNNEGLMTLKNINKVNNRYNLQISNSTNT